MTRLAADSEVGTTFEYDVVAYGSNPDDAKRDAIAWQTRPGNPGPGCAVVSRRTVPVQFGEPYKPEWMPGWSKEWRVPVTWMVTDEPWVES